MESLELTLSETYNRIEKSLNIRFESDTSLYISKADEEKVRKALVDGHYQNLSALSKKLGGKIVAAVILKNSWLVNSSSLKASRRVITEIFESLDKQFMLNVANDVVNDNVFSSIEFKGFVEQFYFDCISLHECKRIFNNRRFKIEIRVQCFSRHIQEVVNSETDGEKIARTIFYELTNNKEIQDYINIKSIRNLRHILENVKDKPGMSLWIIENVLCNPGGRVWEQILLSLGESLLESCCKYVINNPHYEDVTTKYLLQKIFPQLAVYEKFSERVIELYEKNSRIRIYFIHMLQPPKFKNKELANNVLDEFEKNGSFNPNWKEHIERIREWDVSNVSFQASEDVIKLIEEQKANFENVKTLSFYTNKISGNKRLVESLYRDYGERDDVRDILSNCFANYLRSERLFNELNVFSLTQSYKDRISYHIEKNRINTSYAIKFLEENKQFKILENLDRR